MVLAIAWYGLVFKEDIALLTVEYQPDCAISTKQSDSRGHTASCVYGSWLVCGLIYLSTTCGGTVQARDHWNHKSSLADWKSDFAVPKGKVSIMNLIAENT